MFIMQHPPNKTQLAADIKALHQDKKHPDTPTHSCYHHPHEMN